MSNSDFTYNLIVNYYCDKNPERAKELDFCILENLRNEYIDNIVIVCSDVDYEKFKSIYSGGQKLIIIPSETRPTFNDYFRIISSYFNGDNNINIISNLDIIIPSEDLFGWMGNKSVADYLPSNKTCLALTRWDCVDVNNYRNGAVFFDRPDSQDTWIFRGGVPLISGATFGLGIAGCDNAIAHLIEQSGYNVINPSRTIKTYHLHLTNIRNYTNISGHAIERIPPPYKLIHPTE